MIEAGSRKRHQAPPPHILFEALTEPDRDPARPWLRLLDDEHPPRILQTDAPGAGGLVLALDETPGRRWSASTCRRSVNRLGTDLRWTLLVDEPLPDAPLLGHLRKRLNRLINEDLRMTFGQ